MAIDRFLDKDILDSGEKDHNTCVLLQLSRDIKELIKAVRSLRTELDGE